MNIGTKVTWTTSKGVNGSGVLLTDPGKEIPGETVDHCIVVVDAEPGEEHRLIYCAVTWLTEVKP